MTWCLYSADILVWVARVAYRVVKVEVNEDKLDAFSGIWARSQSNKAVDIGRVDGRVVRWHNGAVTVKRRTDDFWVAETGAGRRGDLVGVGLIEVNKHRRVTSLSLQCVQRRLVQPCITPHRHLVIHISTRHIEHTAVIIDQYKHYDAFIKLLLLTSKVTIIASNCLK